jgi:hypothetical protein
VKNPAQHREAEGLTVTTRIASTQPDVGDTHLKFCNREPFYAAGVSASTRSRVRQVSPFLPSRRFFHREILLRTPKITFRYMCMTTF